MAAIATKVSLEEYLRTSYHPDVEYLDGILQARSAADGTHGFFLPIVGSWFLRHSNDWKIVAASCVRTQVSPSRIRLPDIVVVQKFKVSEQILTTPPLIVLDILTCTDAYDELSARAEDFSIMGVENYWLLDPKQRSAEVWTGAQWSKVEGARIDAVNGPAYLDLAWLWAELNDL